MNPSLVVLGLLLALGGSKPAKPQLEVKCPPFVNANDHRGPEAAGIVTITARIKGTINEEWYCPRLEWVWPNYTRSVEEADCAPYSPEEARNAPYRWSRRVRIGEGYWIFRVILWKGDKKLSEQSCTVRVGSPEVVPW